MVLFAEGLGNINILYCDVRLYIVFDFGHHLNLSLGFKGYIAVSLCHFLNLLDPNTLNCLYPH